MCFILRIDDFYESTKRSKTIVGSLEPGKNEHVNNWVDIDEIKEFINTRTAEYNKEEKKGEEPEELKNYLYIIDNMNITSSM